MSKDSSAKYYQNNKERLQKKSREKYRSLSEEEKTRRDNMAANNINISLKIKSKN